MIMDFAAIRTHQLIRCGTKGSRFWRACRLLRIGWLEDYAEKKFQIGFFRFVIIYAEHDNVIYVDIWLRIQKFDHLILGNLLFYVEIWIQTEKFWFSWILWIRYLKLKLSRDIPLKTYLFLFKWCEKKSRICEWILSLARQSYCSWNHIIFCQVSQCYQMLNISIIQTIFLFEYWEKACTFHCDKI